MISILIIMLLFAAGVSCSTAVVYASLGEDSGGPPGTVIRNPLEYVIEINGSQVFPNDTIKNDIINNYTESEYKIPSLEYELLNHQINATGVTIEVHPTKIDDTTTKLDLDIYADQANVTGIYDRYYERLELQSTYGVYDKTTDKMIVHIPIDVALSMIR